MPKRIFQHTFVLGYLFLTAYAFFLTMVGIDPPLIPWPVLRYFYGMMAPYRGYSTFNADLLAEGTPLRPSGSAGQGWERMDLDPRLRSFHAEGEEMHKQKYTELAQLLLEREKRKGKLCIRPPHLAGVAGLSGGI